MVNAGSRQYLRVGELSRLTGVSTSAINYYVREGLLPPPLKTAPNMAYYDPGYVDMVLSIKVLQREKGLSLSEIKELMVQSEFRILDALPPEDFTGAEGTAVESKRALDRRKHIMSVAAGVFAEKGYYATTISDLASAAGIAKGTIYWYFDDKRSIMSAILDEISREINGTFGGIIREAPDGLEAILRCVEPALTLLEKHGPIYLMYFFEIGATDELLQEKYRSIYRAVHLGTGVAIKRGMKEGVIRKVDPDIAAYAVMGIVERVAQVDIQQDARKPLEKKTSETKEFIRAALAKGAAKRSGR